MKHFSEKYASAVYRTPFGTAAPTIHEFAPEMTLAEMVASFPSLPPDFDKRGAITISGHEIYKKNWKRLRLKPGQAATFHYSLAGGGSGGAKKNKGLFALIIGIATILTAGLAASGAFALGGAGSLFAAGTTSAKLLAAGISIVGSLASKAISAPPASADQDKTDDQKGPASISGNLLQAGSSIPRVIGTRKIFPSLVTQPFTYRDGSTNDEIVEAVFALAGPHDSSDIKIGDALIDDSDDVTYQVRNGWDDDSAIDLITSYAVTAQPNLELSVQQVDPDNQNQLLNQDRPELSLPIFHSVGAGDTPDRILIDLDFPQGLYDSGTPDNNCLVPVRIIMRNIRTGISYQLPEFQYKSQSTKEIRPTIELVWRAPTLPIPFSMPVNEGWAYVFTAVPGQTSSITTDGWNSDSSFYSGSGDTYLGTGLEGTTGVVGCYADGQKLYVELQAAAIPMGKYQIKIKRGNSFLAKDFSKDDNYKYTGNVVDFFSYYLDSGTAKVNPTKQYISDKLAILRVSSVYNQHPIDGGKAGSGLFLIAVQAKNRQLDNLSLIASGFVKDWDGSGWNTVTTSSNPATSFYDVLRGQLTPDPLDPLLVDNDSLVEWRQACIDNGYTCDMVCEGEALATVLSKIAGCGYARPRQSETWGVIRDYDRSAEDPLQIFTSRNSFDVSMSNSFTRLPDAFRVQWQDAADDDNPGEIIVYRPGYEETLNPRLEEVQYDGISTEDAARARALFDLKQADMRSSEFTFNAQAEAVRVTRGDLIAVNHDFLSTLEDSARIIDVEIEDGTVIAITTDAPMPVYNELDMLDLPDILAVPDMLNVGGKTSVTIRRADSLIATYALTGETGTRNRLEFATPVTLDLDSDGVPLIREGNLVAVGQFGSEYLRLIVTGITYDSNMTAQITAVAEAPELWAA